MAKKPYCFFTIALNETNQGYLKMMKNSFKKFHPNDELIVYGKEDFEKNLKNKDFMEGVADLRFPDDNMFRLTPLFAKELIKEYELIVRLDADQLIMGDLNYIIDHRHEFDLGTVLNINRVDPLKYKPCDGWGIPANEYYNIGLIAFTSEALVNHLWKLCNSKYFWRLQYREQDLVNAIAVYSGWRTKCFDHYDDKNKYYAWHGLVAKGEGIYMKLEKDERFPDRYKVVLPKGKDNYPDRDLLIKAYHWAGGAYEKKMNYDVYFKGEVLDYIKWLISDTDKPYEKK